MFNVDAAFRAQMRALARKGGAATKRRFRDYPMYFRQIGRLGGRASAAARRARIVAEFELKSGGGEVPVGGRAPALASPRALSAVETIDQILEQLNEPR